MWEPTILTEREAQERWNEYIEAYCTWAEQWEPTLSQNRRIVSEWQVKHDVPYPVYRLSYVVTPPNWSFTGKTESASIWSLTAMPNEQGYWRVIEKGQAIDRHYHMWISVDAETTVRPSQNKFGYVLALPNAQMNVCLHPKRMYKAEELEQELGLMPLPLEPDLPHKVYEQLYPDLAGDLFIAPRDLARREYNRRREEQGLERFDPEDYEIEVWVDDEDDDA